MKNETKNQSLNLSQFRRISLLLDLLRRKPYRTKEQVLDYFEANDKNFSDRTFYRIKELLSREFQIEISFDTTSGGYFFDEEKSINASSFLSLLELIVMADTFSQNNKAKVLSFVAFENEAALESLPNFSIVLDAIRLQLPLEFEHFSFYHLETKTYTLKPYLLKQYQNRWYVIGETNNGYRSFGIDRMNAIQMGSKKFKNKTEEAKTVFKDVIGLNFSDHQKELVELSFCKSQKPYLESLPLHRSQKITEVGNEAHIKLQLFIHPNFEFKQQVLKYGSFVKVTSPQWLADEIKEELKKAIAHYK